MVAFLLIVIAVLLAWLRRTDRLKRDAMGLLGECHGALQGAEAGMSELARLRDQLSRERSIGRALRAFIKQLSGWEPLVFASHAPDGFRVVVGCGCRDCRKHGDTSKLIARDLANEAIAQLKGGHKP